MADSPETPAPAPEAPAAPETPQAPAAPAAPAAPETPETPKTPEPPPAPEATTLTAFERGRLRALGMGGLIREIETARAESATLIARVDDLLAANARLTSQLTALQAQHTTALAAATQGRTNEVAVGVKDTLAALGIPAEAAPAMLGEAETPEALLARYQGLQGAERTAFFRAHRADLLAAEAATK